MQQRHGNLAQDVLDVRSGENREALLFVDSHGCRRDYTFSEVSDYSQRYAAALRALGITQGRRVLLCNSNTAKSLFVILALARLGAVAVLCPQKQTRDEIAALVQATSVEAVIANRARRPLIEHVRGQLPRATQFILVGETCEGWSRLDTLAESAKPFAGIAVQPQDMAAIFVDDILDYAHLFESNRLAGDALDPGASDRIWAAFPNGTQPWFTFVQAPWCGGAASVVHESAFEPRERLELLRDLQISVLCQSPDEYRALLAVDEPNALWLPRLRRCVTRDASIDRQLEERWQRNVGVPLTWATGAPSPQRT
jgi:acetyl-CoA synthetase